MVRTLSIAVLLAAAASSAGWMPDSPLIQAGDNVDIYFTAKARLNYSSNLFFGASGDLPNSGTSWTVAPGLSADFFKESMFSGSVSWRRDFVRYFDSALKSLHDEQDNGGASLTYDGGGPLTLRLEASYGEDARNTVEQIALASSGGTLLRSTSYGQSLNLGYRLTDKLSLNAAASHSSNRYDPHAKVFPAPPPVVYNTEGLTESNGWTFPLGLNYRVRERLTLGLAYEHGHTNIEAARGSTAAAPYTGFTKDFYGLTLSGQPTESGKLDMVLKAGLLRSVYDGGVDARNAPSYSVVLTHELTERMNHSLSLSDSASVAVNGRRSETRAANYTLNWVPDDTFRASATAGISLSKVGSGTPTDADIRAGSYGLNATYTPDSHWTFTAGYTLYQAYRPSSYNVHQFSLEANLRW